MSIIRSGIRRLSATRPLYLQLLFVTLAFGLMVAVSGIVVNNMQMRQLRERAETTINQARLRIAAELQEPETLMLFITSGIRDILNSGGSLEEVRAYADRVSEGLQNKPTGLNSDGIHVYLESMEGYYIPTLGWEVPSDYFPEGQIWYRTAIREGDVIAATPIYIGARQNKHQFSFVRRLLADDGSPLAVVVLDVTIDNITDIVVNTQISQGGYGFLANRRFELVAHPNEEFLGRSIGDADVDNHVIMEDHLLRYGFVNEYKMNNYQGVDTYLFAREIDNGWYLGFVAPIHEYYRQYRMLMMLLCALGIVLMGAMALILIRIDISKNKSEKAFHEQGIQLAVMKERQAAEEDIQLLFDAAPFGATLLDKNFKLIRANYEMARIFGLKDKEEYLAKFAELSPEYQPDGRLSSELAQAYTQKAYEEGLCVFEWMHQKPDGELIPSEITLVRLEYGNDHVLGGYTRDLRGEKKTEELARLTDVLKGREAMLKAINEMAIILTSHSSDSFGNVMSTGLKAVAGTAGIDQVAVYRRLGETTRYGQVYLWHGETIPLEEEAAEIPETPPLLRLLEVLLQGQCINGNVKEMPEDEAGFLSMLGVKAVYFVPIFVHGEVWGIITLEDHTNYRYFEDDKLDLLRTIAHLCAAGVVREEMEREVNHANAMLAQATAESRYKSFFLATVGHEIRTPMNTILGITEIQLLKAEQKTEEVEEALIQINAAGTLLLNIINDVLDLSKIEADKLEITLADYDIPSLIHDVVQLNQLRYENKALDFIININKKTPLNLLGDEIRIKQVLNNLLSNAFKFTDDGRIELSVYAEPGEKDHETTLILSVRDTGQGMTAVQVERLFDKNTWVNMQANRTNIGLGLGMSITKRLVDLMEGEIIVESEPDKGSLFIVRLPQKVIGSTLCGANIMERLNNYYFRHELKAKREQIGREQMPYGRVLIVDDVASNLFVAKGLMVPYGLTIETATSGFEAIKKIKEGKEYDIIFMDHMMPKMDGIEATGIIRDMGYTNPIVALTANAVIGQDKEFLTSKFNGLMTKPIDSRELDMMLNNFIRDKQPPGVLEEVRQGLAEKRNPSEDRSSLSEKKEASQEKMKDSKREEIDSEMAYYFVLDAESAVEVLEDIYGKIKEAAHTVGNDSKNITIDEDDQEMYITYVHGMKSALANIGETTLSGEALNLEMAGTNGDYSVILEKTPLLIDSLKDLIKKHKAVKKSKDVEISEEDRFFLWDKARELKKSCITFDRRSAKEALEELKLREWPSHINEVLNNISAHLLHSAFKKAIEAIEGMAKEQT